jgi:hypothetical protein
LRNLEQNLNSSGPAGRYETLVRMASLKELAGDIEGAAKTWETAAQADPGSRDHRSMLRGAACFTALGEWERAEAALRGVLLDNRDPEIRTRARLLAAQLEILRSGGAASSGLVSLLADGAFGVYKPQIYFTLWKLTGRESWRGRLVEEFPRSPEGRIAAAGAAVSAPAAAAGSPPATRAGGPVISAAPTAMWLLFPGREDGTPRPGSPARSPAAEPAPRPGLAAESAAPASPAIPAGGAAPPAPVPVAANPIRPSAAPTPPPAPVTASPAAPSAVTAGTGNGPLLQAGFFGREENARTLMEQLRRAGFPVTSARHQRPGGTYTAVYVIPGRDINASIRELRDAGFESFPVTVTR